MKITIEINYNAQESTALKIVNDLKASCDAKIIDIETKQAKRRYTSEYFKKVVFRHYNIPPEMAESKSRKRELVQARQIAMNLSKQYTKESCATIGRNIGHKDHATVLHAAKTVNNFIETDYKFRNEYNKIERIALKSSAIIVEK